MEELSSVEAWAATWKGGVSTDDYFIFLELTECLSRNKNREDLPYTLWKNNVKKNKEGPPFFFYPEKLTHLVGLFLIVGFFETVEHGF